MLVTILLILPMIADSRIAIDINLQLNGTEIQVKSNYSGHHFKAMTAEDFKLFNVDKERLKMGMHTVLNRDPDDIYLNNPTPHGDLFNNLHWKEMQVRLGIEKVSIIDTLREDVALATHEHINNATEIVTFNRSMYETIQNSVSSTWSNTGLPVNNININVTINFGYGKFKYINIWRHEAEHAVKLPIGVTSDETVMSQAGTTIVTKLIASKTTVILKLEYKAQLTGNIIAWFIEKYGSHYFWGPTVESVMEATKIPNGVYTTEIVEIKCFTDPRLLVYGKAVKKKRPKMKIIRSKNKTRVIYIKTKRPKKSEKKLQNKVQ